jgi:peptidoglycan/xylan/chitin deacetylase (PgdA/CDA1 family)
MKTRAALKTLAIRTACNRSVQSIASRLNKSKIIFLAYHGISENTEKLRAWTLIPVDSFQRQMKFVKDHFECMHIDQALNSDLRSRNIPGVVVTFDDGYSNNLNVALPILQEMNIPTTVYITTRHVTERRLFWPDIIWKAANRTDKVAFDVREIALGLREYDFCGDRKDWQNEVLHLLEDVKKTHPMLREGIVRNIIDKFSLKEKELRDCFNAENNVFSPLTIKEVQTLSSHPLVTVGAHSHCHNLLDQVSLKEANESIEKSKRLLEEITGIKVDHFAYPNGNANTRLVELVKMQGFKSAVTFKGGFYCSGDNPYTINRFGVGADMAIDTFKAMLTGIFCLKTKFLKTGTSS